jgi:chromosomal replication initiation ATPase DnaA
MTTVKQYWPHVMKFLQTQISRSHYDTWFSSLDFNTLEDDGHKVVIEVPSQFSANYIRSKYIKQLREAVQKYYPQVVHIDFKVMEQTSSSDLQDEELQQEIAFDSVQTSSEVNLHKSQTRHGEPLQLINNLHNLNPSTRLRHL